jgi:methionyl-tRNA formyltransferase
MRQILPLPAAHRTSSYNNLMNIIFFGSFQHYSALILQALIDSPDISVTGVITTPPMPVGRKQIVTKTPVHLLAEKYKIPVFTPQKLEASMLSNDARSRTPLAGVEDVDLKYAQPTIPKTDIFITAGYGKILPQSWLDFPSHGSLNLHFSLLPDYRGANPAEWAIMCGETKTGITLMKMSTKLDGGDILAQAEIPIDSTDTRETLYHKLYSLGAEHLPKWLLEWQEFAERSRTPLAGVEHRKIAVRKQPSSSPTPYAALLKRQDGFIPWKTVQKYLNHQKINLTDFPSKYLQKALRFVSNDARSRTPLAGVEDVDLEQSKARSFLTRLPRALATYPSLWTIIPTTKRSPASNGAGGDKRMKILSFIRASHASPLQIGVVQIEGKQPALFNQVKNLIK